MDQHKHNVYCKSLLENLSDYIDGDLQSELCAELEQHLEGCEDCRIVVDTLRKTVDLYRKTSEPVEIPISVRQRLYEKLNLDSAPKKS